MSGNVSLWYTVGAPEIAKILGLSQETGNAFYGLENGYWFTELNKATQRMFTQVARSMEHAGLRESVTQILNKHPSVNKKIKRYAFFDIVLALYDDTCVRTPISQTRLVSFLEYRDKVVNRDDREALPDFPRFKKQCEERSDEGHELKKVKAVHKSLVQAFRKYADANPMNQSNTEIIELLEELKAKIFEC